MNLFLFIISSALVILGIIAGAFKQYDMAAYAVSLACYIKIGLRDEQTN